MINTEQLQSQLSHICEPFKVELQSGEVGGAPAVHIRISTTVTIGMFNKTSDISEQVVSVLQSAFKSNPLVKNIIQHYEASLAKLKAENVRLEDEVNEMEKYRTTYLMVGKLLGRGLEEEV